MHSEWSDVGLSVVGVHLYSDSERRNQQYLESTRDFLGRGSESYPWLFDEHGVTAAAYGVDHDYQDHPMAVLVGPDGRIAWRGATIDGPAASMGNRPSDALRGAVRDALAMTVAEPLRAAMRALLDQDYQAMATEIEAATSLKLDDDATADLVDLQARLMQAEQDGLDEIGDLIKAKRMPAAQFALARLERRFPGAPELRVDREVLAAEIAGSITPTERDAIRDLAAIVDAPDACAQTRLDQLAAFIETGAPDSVMALARDERRRLSTDVNRGRD